MSYRKRSQVSALTGTFLLHAVIAWDAAVPHVNFDAKAFVFVCGLMCHGMSQYWNARSREAGGEPALCATFSVCRDKKLQPGSLSMGLGAIEMTAVPLACVFLAAKANVVMDFFIVGLVHLLSGAAARCILYVPEVDNPAAVQPFMTKGGLPV
jgi:hypothetical protein